ncbi:MAG: hypothetical protein CMI53_00140 [Parcubacteria group bacterium]|nr:hypothetical protein [Parcubacteria group bacterium]
MISLINIQCPHCNVQKAILIPPIGSILIGLCKDCNDSIAIFEGQALALDTQIIRTADIENRKKHLLEILDRFLKERIFALMPDE